jgi:hypothetical protein
MRTIAPFADEIRANDQRPPVLYLRPFKDDNVTFPFWLSRWREGWKHPWVRPTYEEHLRDALSEIGPVIAIGNPSEAYPFLGAARLYIEGEEWQTTVLQLMSESGSLAIYYVIQVIVEGGMSAKIAVTAIILNAGVLLGLLVRKANKAI